LTSGAIASGSLDSAFIASGAIVSGDIGNNAVVSGSIASGQVTTQHLASGTSVTQAEILSDSSFITTELISGGRAVAFTSSGTLQIAMAAIPSRMPAVGVLPTNVASGQPAAIIQQGRSFSTNYNFSGFGGGIVFVGASGSLDTVQTTLSGALIQPIGVVANTSSGQTPELFVVAVPASGAITGVNIASGAITSGMLASGLVTNITVSSGSIGSGLIASGAVDGFFGPSRRIQSGTVGVFDFGSGAVIAGTVGSGAIVSGNIASGQIGTNHLASGISFANARAIVDGITYTTAEPISGSTARAVTLNLSGNAIIAMAAVSGRMPAIGFATANVLSGQLVSLWSIGAIQTTLLSGLVAPKPIFVEASGALTTTAPAASGNVQQRMGLAANGSGGFFLPSLNTTRV
jgi:hypothetical protein